MNFKPKYISFDCYGTLINFGMSAMTRQLYADRVPADRMDAFVKNFASYRLDEVMGDWKPYEDVIVSAIRRTCNRWKVEYRGEEGRAFYQAVPTWGPHPDVPAGLARLAKAYPLVILSNASNDQIPANVAKLGAPFHRVYTAQQAQAYKPRLAAFEYMLDQLGCNPEDMLHVSSSFRYDLMSATDIGIKNKVFVARGHDVVHPGFEHTAVKDIGELASLLGL